MHALITNYFEASLSMLGVIFFVEKQIFYQWSGSGWHQVPFQDFLSFSCFHFTILPLEVFEGVMQLTSTFHGVIFGLKLDLSLWDFGKAVVMSREVASLFSNEAVGVEASGQVVAVC